MIRKHDKVKLDGVCVTFGLSDVGISPLSLLPSHLSPDTG